MQFKDECEPGFSKTTNSPQFVLRDSRASETRARVKITPREKRRHAAGREKNDFNLVARAFPLNNAHPFLREKPWGRE